MRAVPSVGKVGFPLQKAGEMSPYREKESK